MPVKRTKRRLKTKRGGASASDNSTKRKRKRSTSASSRASDSSQASASIRANASKKRKITDYFLYECPAGTTIYRPGECKSTPFLYKNTTWCCDDEGEKELPVGRTREEVWWLRNKKYKQEWAEEHARRAKMLHRLSLSPQQRRSHKKRRLSDVSAKPLDSAETFVDNLTLLGQNFWA